MSLQALLTHLTALKGPEALPMMVLDCRLVNITTPDEMARQLSQIALPLRDKVVAILLSMARVLLPNVTLETAEVIGAKGTIALNDFGDRISKAFEAVGTVPSLSSVLDSYEKMMSELPKTGPVPIIVIGAPLAAVSRDLEWRCAAAACAVCRAPPCPPPG